MKRISVVLSALAAVIIAAPAAQATPAIFSAVCAESHISRDDPIVKFGMPGGAHSHDFTGAMSTNAFSTYESLRASQTTCNQEGDTAAYWDPSLFDPDGNRVARRGKAAFAYYVPGDGAKGRPQAIVPHPPGLKMIADMSASAQYGSGWHCGDGAPPSQGGTLSATEIPDCHNRDDGPGGRFPDNTMLQAKVVFPDCWDGQNLDSPDHRSHMAYGSNNTCPPSHPVPVPRINQKNTYATYGGPGFSIATDGVMGRGDPASYHADFFNAWDQEILKKLVAVCINDPDAPKPAGLDCEQAGDPVPNPNHPDPTPAPEAPPPPPPPPPAHPCEGGALMNDMLEATGKGDNINYTSTAAGRHSACLEVPAGADFDLALKRVNSDGSVSTVLYKPVRGNAVDESYDLSTLAAGDYRIRVTSYSGSGAYALKFDYP